MSYAHIYLTPTEDNPLGVIGEVEGENGESIKGIMLADVVSQVAKYPNANAFLFHCSGPGGAVDVGDQIYAYMESLKAQGKQVDTVTDGDIGSIMTKPFMSGQNRTIGEDHKLFVHAPWVPHLEGNATQITTTLQGLMAEEDKLLSFYKEKTGITDAGIKGLMDGSSGNDGTFITADQAVAMKFATHKAPSKIKAFALIKNNMSKEKTTGQKFGELVDMLLGNRSVALDLPLKKKVDPNAQPTPAAKPAMPMKPANIDLPTEDGGILTSDATDISGLVGSNITVVDSTGASAPAPDGDYELADGTIITVVGGKCTAAAPEQIAPGGMPDAGIPNAQQLEIDALKAELKALKETPAVDIKAEINAALDAFKASASAGKTPPRALNNTGNQNDANAPKQRTINEVMALKVEERKKYINGNKI